MRWFVIAVLVLGMGVALAQAPIVRRPPTADGAQAPPGLEGDVPTIKVETRLVNVALNVSDAKGAPVGGLGRDDFKVDARVLRRGLLDNGYSELPIVSDHVVAIESLPTIHKDPFDRLLVAQATVEGITLLTIDSLVAKYPAPIRMV